MLLFPAASVSYSDFSVNEMWPKGVELHPEEVHGEAGLGGSMGWYVLICIGTQGKEPLGELLGKMTESASVNEFERLEKTECKGKIYIWKWHSAETNLICLLALYWGLSLKHQQPVTSCGPDVALPGCVSITATL